MKRPIYILYASPEAVYDRLHEKCVLDYSTFPQALDLLLDQALSDPRKLLVRYGTADHVSNIGTEIERLWRLCWISDCWQLFEKKYRLWQRMEKAVLSETKSDAPNVEPKVLIGLSVWRAEGDHKPQIFVARLENTDYSVLKSFVQLLMSLSESNTFVIQPVYSDKTLGNSKLSLEGFIKKFFKADFNQAAWEEKVDRGVENLQKEVDNLNHEGLPDNDNYEVSEYGTVKDEPKKSALTVADIKHFFGVINEVLPAMENIQTQVEKSTDFEIPTQSTETTELDNLLVKIAEWNDKHPTVTSESAHSVSDAIGEHDPNGLSPSSPGAKLDAGKNQLSLVFGGFANALDHVGRVGTYGAVKYSPGGWVSVPDGQKRYTDAMLRHLIAEFKGEEVDQDSGLLHAAQVAWNALARLDLALRKQDQST